MLCRFLLLVSVASFAVLAQEYEHEARVAPTKEILLTRLPPLLIRLLIAILAPLGRLLGYERLLRHYSSRSETAPLFTGEKMTP